MLRSIVFVVLVVGLRPAIGQESPTERLKIEPVAVGPFAARIVWPLSGTEKPDLPAWHTFGPRQIASQGYRYDFNRALDIQCPTGTPIHSLADGEVRIAGKHPSYADQVVQIKHYRPSSGDKCGDAGCWYTTFRHLSEVSVKVGDAVKAGDVVGRSGANETGFEYCKFDIRDGDLFQRFAIHPLCVLPYADSGAPKITIDSVDASKAATTVAVTATCPGDEPDLVRVDVAVFDGAKELGRRSYDLNEWNRAFTPEKDGAKILDQQLVHHVNAEPGRFRAGQALYELTLVFDDLPVVADKRRLIVRAKAIDALGNASAEVERKASR